MIKSLVKKLLIISALPIFVFAQGDQSLPKVTNVDSNGVTITLSDETSYEIGPDYRQVVTRWSTIPGRENSVEVVNSKNVNREYPIDITNQVTNETVQARLPQNDIDEANVEAPSEDNEGD